jgi:hypothetical protein
MPINDAIKDAYTREFLRPQNIYVIDRGTNTLRATRVTPAPVTITNWAQEVPPFRADALIAFAPDGTLWVQRTTFGREGARYDVIGADGRLRFRTVLPEGHRVAGFGRDAMFVVRRDADDVEFLQKHPFGR